MGCAMDTMCQSGNNQPIDPFQLPLKLLQAHPGKELRIGKFHRGGLDHFRRFLRILNPERPFFDAHFEDTGQNLPLPLQPFIMKFGPLGCDDLRELDNPRVLFKRRKRLPQILKQKIAQPCRRVALRASQNMIEIIGGLDGGAAANLFRNIELTRKKPVKITRRHIAIPGELRHRGLAIPVMRKPLTSRFDNLFSGLIQHCHAMQCNERH